MVKKQNSDSTFSSRLKSFLQHPLIVGIALFFLGDFWGSRKGEHEPIPYPGLPQYLQQKEPQSESSQLPETPIGNFAFAAVVEAGTIQVDESGVAHEAESIELFHTYDLKIKAGPIVQHNGKTVISSVTISTISNDSTIAMSRNSILTGSYVVTRNSELNCSFRLELLSSPSILEVCKDGCKDKFGRYQNQPARFLVLLESWTPRETTEKEPCSINF